jgi:hypothetical protein
MLMFLAIVGGIALFILFLGVLSIYSQDDEIERQRREALEGIQKLRDIHEAYNGPTDWDKEDE